MLPSIVATPVWCQASSTHPHILGTTTCDGPLSSAGILASLFHSHHLPAHRTMHAQARRWRHFLHHLLQAPCNTLI